MKKITVSAPGKLMLFGEHAVVYGRPCLVTAVGQRMRAIVELTEDSMFQLDAPDVSVSGYRKPMSELGKGDPSTSLGTSIPKGAKFVEVAVKNFFSSQFTSKERASVGTGSTFEVGKAGIKVTTSSEFSSEFGFGSSSAATVCVIKALSELTGKKLSKKNVFDLSYKTVLEIQGQASGFDVAAATFGGTLYFVIGGKVIKQLNLPSLPLIVGYSGIKADTVTLVNQVKKKANKYPKVIDDIYDSIGYLVNQAKNALVKGDFQTVGELMNLNQGYLESLGVSSDKLESMIHAAREAGAYGAKLSGAGGGDCMIALAPNNKVEAVKKAINNVGGQVVDIKAHIEGVRIDG